MPAWLLPAAGMAVGAGLSWWGQRQANAANAQQAQRQMDFQADQTGTAYQRAVEDMRKAGLNPALAYQQGGAQSGGGAQAQLGNSLGAAASGAMHVAQTYANIDNTRAQTAKTTAEAEQVTLESLARIEQLKAAARQLDAGARNLDANTTTEDSFRAIRFNKAVSDAAIRNSERRFWDESFAERLEALRLQNILTTTNARHGNASATLLELQRPGYENEAAADRTKWRQFMPYAHDAASVIGGVLGGTVNLRNSLMTGTTEETQHDWDSQSGREHFKTKKRRTW